MSIFNMLFVSIVGKLLSIETIIFSSYILDKDIPEHCNYISRDIFNIFIPLFLVNVFILYLISYIVKSQTNINVLREAYSLMCSCNYYEYIVSFILQLFYFGINLYEYCVSRSLAEIPIWILIIAYFVVIPIEFTTFIWVYRYKNIEYEFTNIKHL